MSYHNLYNNHHMKHTNSYQVSSITSQGFHFNFFHHGSNYINTLYDCRCLSHKVKLKVPPLGVLILTSLLPGLSCILLISFRSLNPRVGQTISHIGTDETLKFYLHRYILEYPVWSCHKYVIKIYQ